MRFVKKISFVPRLMTLNKFDWFRGMSGSGNNAKTPSESNGQNRNYILVNY